MEVAAGALLGMALTIAYEKSKRNFQDITPLVDIVEKYLSKELEESPRKAIEHYKLLLIEESVSLTKAYEELRHRDVVNKHRHKRRIKHIKRFLRWMEPRDVQPKINLWVENKELMVKMSEMNAKLDKITPQPTD